MSYQDIVEPTLKASRPFVGLFRIGPDDTAYNRFVVGQVVDDIQRWRVVNGGWEWCTWRQLVMRLALTSDVPVTMIKVSR